MKRLFVILTSALLASNMWATDFSTLDSLLVQFYGALLPEPIETKIREFDSLIETCNDSLTRQHVALTIFDHYREPELMGDEEIAVHIYDRWFADGTVSMTGEMEKFEARMFADFNRNTLIGHEAPLISMYDKCGKLVQLPEKGKCSILFFYDTSCAKCRLEMKVLPQILESIDFPINFYAVYCGSDKKSWRRFRNTFRPRNRKLTTVHLWDPEMETDYLRLYGIISTPKMYMTEPQGNIMGRRLEPESLMELIPVAGAIQAVYDKHINNTD